MSIDAHIRNATRRYASRPALIDGERRWTFAEFEDVVARVAAGLSRRLEPGSRVGLFMVNRAEYLILQLAVERAGLVRVPLNMRYTAYEVERTLEDCSAAAVFADPTTIGRTAGIEDNDIWIVDVDGDAMGGPTWRSLLRSEAVPGPAFDNFDALCSINYTSGSSGAPKGVMLSHRNWLSVYKNMLVDRDIRGSDRLAHIGPLTHASGAYFTPFLLRGATNVIVPGGAVDALLPTIERERITAFSCVPTVLTRIIGSGAIDRHDLSTIRWIGYGAEAIQRNTLEKAVARWGKALTHNYGLTEAMMTCSFLTADEQFGPDGEPRHGCIGRPYSFVDIVLRDADGTEVADGEIGEITIRAEHVMQGYWNKPDETAKVLRDGWLWSGDLARRDPSGLIHIVGRSKEMLISGGFNIYPAEVEACLSSCLGVQEAAVVGMPDEQFGEICVAFVAAEPGVALTREICEAHCRPRIGIRTPRIWFFLPQMPRTGNGKVDKAALKSRLAALEPAS